MPNKYLDSVGLAEYTSLIKAELAPKNSPALTGTPTAPTPTAGDDSTKIATTAFVQEEVANYLPLSGGSVTGNLSVSGTITGNVTGNVTGTASGNLPLSGGIMSGNVDFNENRTIYTKYGHRSTINVVGNSTDSGLGLLSKMGSFNDTYLVLRSSDQTSDPRFVLAAGDGTTVKSLVGKPDGTLTWSGKEIERLNAIGSNYIRYESGFQICWGRIGDVTTSGTTVTLPASFVGDYGLTFGNGTNAIPKFGEITTTSFKVTMTTGTDNVRYVAIGRWK